MGLSVSHDCWCGSCSGFGVWRRAIAHAAGYPPLEFMEGYYDERSGLINCHATGVMYRLPIPWDQFQGDPLTLLLNHSDCDGVIKWQYGNLIANRLSDVLQFIYDVHRDEVDNTANFIKGLRDAHEKMEDVEFS